MTKYRGSILWLLSCVLACPLIHCFGDILLTASSQVFRVSIFKERLAYRSQPGKRVLSNSHHQATCRVTAVRLEKKAACLWECVGGERTYLLKYISCKICFRHISSVYRFVSTLLEVEILSKAEGLFLVECLGFMLKVLWKHVLQHTQLW